MKKIFFMLLCGAMMAGLVSCEGNEPENDSNSSSTENNDSTTHSDGKLNTNGHEYVDLGLPSGTLWATCNVGATAPEEYGDYFAWGETQPQEKYNWTTYKYGTYNFDNDFSTLTKYNPTDGKTILEASDDAATANWGGDWRMPTKAELDELRTECTWTWTTLNGVNGYEVKGTNRNFIFLPEAGYRDDSDFGGADLNGSYWSSSLDESRPHYAYGLYFYSGDQVTCGYGRRQGLSVRPVCSSR